MTCSQLQASGSLDKNRRATAAPVFLDKGRYVFDPTLFDILFHWVHIEGKNIRPCTLPESPS